MMDDGIRRLFDRSLWPDYRHPSSGTTQSQRGKGTCGELFASVAVPEACRLQASGGRSLEDQVGAELEHTAVLKQRGCEPLCAVRDGEPPRHRISSFGFQCTSWRLRVTSREEDGQTPRAELGRVEVDAPRNLQLDALDARRRRIDLAVDGQQ